MTLQRSLATLILGGLTLVGLLILVKAGLNETSGTNSYALLAESFLNGRFDTTQCFDTDCATFEGRQYVIFPPVPAIIALPFVALFGADFDFFIPLGAIAIVGIGLFWWRIGEKLTSSRDLTILLVLLILFATPLFFVSLRGDRVWFFAQIWGFFFASAALYSALIRQSALAAGLFIGLAFLCRQMTILFVPFLYVLLLRDEDSLFRIDGAAVKRALTLLAFPLAALAIYFAYNAARFGSPLDTGYAYIFQGQDSSGFIRRRSNDIGSFSPDYLIDNLLYMFFQGPHVEVTGNYMTEIAGFDLKGAGLFVVTPVLLLGLLARWNRVFLVGTAVALTILTVTLFYHSNGFSQYSAQRYALDWLPILLVFVAMAMRREYLPVLTILIIHAMGLTIGMTVIGALAEGVAG